MGRIINTMLAAVAVMSVAACASSAPPMESLPPMSFADGQPFVLNVARIEIVSQFQTPSTAPHIELQVPVSPENAIRRWVQDRLQPRGTTGTLRVVIKNASATETALPQSDSGANVFGNQPQTKVDVAVDVSLEILDDRQMVTAEVSAQAARAETLITDLKLNARDRILYNMVREVVRAMGDQLTPRIGTTFHNQLIL
jgi:hypothetical protein